MLRSGSDGDRQNTNTLLITVNNGSGAESSVDSTQMPESWDQLLLPTRSELSEFINDDIIELLEILSDVEPGSVRECARLADRGAKNVYEDLVALEERGVVEMEQRGLGEKPVFRYDKIVVEIDLVSE